MAREPADKTLLVRLEGATGFVRSGFRDTGSVKVRYGDIVKYEFGSVTKMRTELPALWVWMGDGSYGAHRCEFKKAQKIMRAIDAVWIGQEYGADSG